MIDDVVCSRRHQCSQCVSWDILYTTKWHLQCFTTSRFMSSQAICPFAQPSEDINVSGLALPLGFHTTTCSLSGFRTTLDGKGQEYGTHSRRECDVTWNFCWNSSLGYVLAICDLLMLTELSISSNYNLFIFINYILIHKLCLGILLQTWINFNPSMDK